MRFSPIFALPLLAPLAAAVSVGSPKTGGELLSRQLSEECIKNYGKYEVYPYRNSGDTDCGAKHLNCRQSSQYCVIYPSFDCPPRGYTCSYY